MTSPALLSKRLESLVFGPELTPPALMDALASEPVFTDHLRANVGVHVLFTLREHTLRVLDCYEKHFAPRSAPHTREAGCFRLFLALHDIGKPLAIQAGDKSWQHRFTVDLMRRTRALYPVTDVEFEDWIALVDGDPLGAYLKGEMSADETGSLIRRMAARSSLELGGFCRRLTVYYQCDASAYTRRGGLMNSLDGLFEWGGDNEILFDPANQLLKFSVRIRAMLSGLSPDAYRVGGLS